MDNKPVMVLTYGRRFSMRMLKLSLTSCSISNDITQMVNFPTWITGFNSLIHALLDWFISSRPNICPEVAFAPLGNSYVVLLLTFLQTQRRMPRVIPKLENIPVLIGTVFVSIWEIFQAIMCLNSVPLLLLLNFVSWSRLEWMYISLIGNISHHYKYQGSYIFMVFSYLCCCHSS